MLNIIPRANILRSFTPESQSEGVGATVKRIIGNQLTRNFDPFLMLDYFKVKLPSGFPDHPHRGFETVTYMKSGAILHEDFKGHKGRLEPGDVQWMTAGKGIVHAEMPASRDEHSIGFQLWLNLAKKDKMTDPRYQEFKRADIPSVVHDNLDAVVISGEVLGVKGVIEARTPTHYIDFKLKPKGQYSHVIPATWNAFIFIYNGSLKVNDKVYNKETAVFFKSDKIDTSVAFESVDTSADFIWVSGKPIGEEVVQYGPFVMNSKQEIESTFKDYQRGENGFEASKHWQSDIQNLSFEK